MGSIFETTPLSLDGQVQDPLQSQTSELHLISARTRDSGDVVLEYVTKFKTR
jgi:hypothetical protein